MAKGIILWGNSTDRKTAFNYKRKLWQGLNPEFRANVYSEHWEYRHCLLNTFSCNYLFDTTQNIPLSTFRCTASVPERL